MAVALEKSRPDLFEKHRIGTHTLCICFHVCFGKMSRRCGILRPLRYFLTGNTYNLLSCMAATSTTTARCGPIYIAKKGARTYVLFKLGCSTIDYSSHGRAGVATAL